MVRCPALLLAVLALEQQALVHAATTNECHPSKGCNVCAACCNEFIPAGTVCDACAASFTGIHCFLESSEVNVSVLVLDLCEHITPLISLKASTFRRPFSTAHREAGMQCSNNLCKCAWNTRPTPLSDPIRMHSSKMSGYECMRTVCDAPG